MNYKQGSEQSACEYAEEIVAKLEVLELANGPLCIGEKGALFEKMETLYNGYMGHKKRNSVVHGKTCEERVND